jgi:hypothetical protein
MDVCDGCGYCILCSIRFQLQRIADALHGKEDDA